jgi:hypothetical protein
MDWNDENENTDDSIRIRREFDSGGIDESQSQNEKHFDPRIPIWFAIKIDWSDEDEKASDLVRVKCEFDSNSIDESDLQFEKRFDPKISTSFGITIDWNDEDENTADSIRVKCESDSNVMKVIDNLKNILIQTFQSSFQFHLTMI